MAQLLRLCTIQKAVRRSCLGNETSGSNYIGSEICEDLWNNGPRFGDDSGIGQIPKIVKSVVGTQHLNDAQGGVQWSRRPRDACCTSHVPRYPRHDWRGVLRKAHKMAGGQCSLDHI